MCLIDSLEVCEPVCTEPTWSQITATGAGEGVILIGIVTECSSMPDRDNTTLKQCTWNSIFISLYKGLEDWVKFVYKTNNLQEASLFIAIDGEVIELNRCEFTHEINISHVPDNWQLNFTWKE